VNVDLVVRVDRLPRAGETVTGGSFERHGGGKGANQAVAAARAGARVGFVGAVGDDEMGRVAADELASEGIDLSGLARLPDAPTGIALITVDARGDNQIAVASGANARVDRGLVEAALERLDLGDVAVCLLGFEVPVEAAFAAAEWLAPRGVTLVLDPAPPQAIPGALLGLAPILTPNRVEAAALTGEGDPGRAARHLSAQTGAPAIVTLGAEGIILAEDDRVERVPAPIVEAVDSTGAGDVFCGVLAARLAAGDELREAVEAASTAASGSVTRRGAR
jgi:ribokinase